MSGRPSAPCPLCGGPARPRLRKSGHAIYRCAPCDFELVHPTPSQDQLDRLYAEQYFTGQGCGYADYFASERASNLKKAEQRLSRLEQLGAPPGARLLDVGCADGVFVEAALARQLDAHGVEVSREALAALPPHLRDRVHGSVELAAAGDGFAVITLWDVLEHLPDFLGALRNLRAHLAPSGLLGVVVPVIDNANARLWPSSWDQYKPPEHLSYFSRRSLRALLEREVGEVLLEESAWRREGRVSEVARPARSRMTRMAGDVECALWRAGERLGLVAPSLLDDSVAMYARAR